MFYDVDVNEDKFNNRHVMSLKNSVREMIEM